ncbi:hypothetical protein ABT352_00355 [Streptosporangium sp. NPDC000563]|uniref:hypothetical protein n=1 Tax=unclassified Streptosporangium TaxID=2632669 RepID=UPI00332CE54F
MIAKPPGWPLLTAFSFAAFVCLWWSSAPYPYVELFIWVIFAGGALFLLWIIRAVPALLTDIGAMEANMLRWLMPWIIAGCTALAISADIPFQVRFTLSKSALTDHAQAVARSGTSSHECRLVGLYPVCWSAATPDGGAQFSIDDWRIRTSAGFVWSPTGQVSEEGPGRLDPISGPWYAWSAWDRW